MDTNTSRLGGAFLVAAVLFLLTGLYLFIFAESVATLPADARGANAWPWPIGPLALRFVASLLIAAGVAFLLVGRRPDYPSFAAFASISAGVTGMLILHLLLNFGAINWSRPLAYVWPAALAVGFVCSVLLVLWARRKATLTVPPLPTTPPMARYVAMLVFGLTLVVGGIMFFLPDLGRERWPWDLINSTNVQFLGAVFLSACISSLLTLLHPSWYGYDLFYPSAGSFVTFALVASFMHWNLFTDKPLTSWIFVAIYILSGVLAFYTYFRYPLRPPTQITPQPS
jgi:hypothetical protein